MKHCSCELQRSGRNKSVSINHSYINSGEYKRKFNYITDNPKLNKLLYQLAKKMLVHRSGTNYEDMYWINVDTLQIIASEINCQTEHKISYSRKTKQRIKSAAKLKTPILTIHSHPNSFPPSIEDLNSNHNNNYTLGIICCHDGKIFTYSSSQHINKLYYQFTMEKFLQKGYNEFESQMLTLYELQNNFHIFVKEVV